jgi:hypothetical protein
VAASEPGSQLTVAIPTYNGAAHLAEALQSIVSQTGTGFELLVSDDCSSDDTLEVVRAIAGDRARVEVNGKRLGLAGNWNRCAKLARTPFVAIFHQDDMMLPGHLDAHIAAFGGDDAIGMTASSAVVIDGDSWPVPPSVVEQGGLGPIDRVFEPGRLAQEMARGNPLRCSAVMMRAAAFEDVGGFDPAWRYVLDWDFWLRLSRRWRVAWLARPTVQVRWHGSSETHRFQSGLGDLDETARMLEQLFVVDLNKHPRAACLRQAANDRLGRAYLNRAHDALGAGRAELARESLRRGFRCAPGLLKTIVGDPRLCISMATLAAAPRLAARLFAREKNRSRDRDPPGVEP